MSLSVLTRAVTRIRNEYPELYKYFGEGYEVSVSCQPNRIPEISIYKAIEDNELCERDDVQVDSRGYFYYDFSEWTNLNFANLMITVRRFQKFTDEEKDLLRKMGVLRVQESNFTSESLSCNRD